MCAVLLLAFAACSDPVRPKDAAPDTPDDAAIDGEALFVDRVLGGVVWALR